MKIDDLDSSFDNRLANRKIVLVKDLEDDKQYKKSRKKAFWKRLGIALAALVVAALLAFSVKSLFNRYTYRSVKLVQETVIGSIGDARYISYQDGAVRFGINGAEYINNKGEVIWNVAYEMKNPVVNIEGPYAVIADIGGTAFVICGADGAISNNRTTNSILDADISRAGAVCIVTDTEKADYVNFYDKNGNEIDIEIKTILAGDGYPMDMSMSEDGQVLMMSYLYMNEGMMRNKVVFYNFSELGENYSDRLVGVFNDFGESIVPVVKILSKDSACAFAQNGVSFYSIKSSTKPVEIGTYEYETEIKSVFSSDKYVGVISENSDGNAGCNLDIYTAEGVKKLNASITFDYDEVKFIGDKIILNNSDYCIVYTVDGSLKYEGSIGDAIRFITGVKGNRLLSFNDSKVSEYRFRY